MFLILPPASELATLVHGYWFIEDMAGEHAGRLIRTSPVPLAVLSVNMGRPNMAENGEPVPPTSLLGLQPQARGWRSFPETCFVMAMLTIAGLVRLFPHTGPESAGRLLDLAAMTGDTGANALRSSVGLELDPRRIAFELDRWLISRLRDTSPAPESAAVSWAHDILRRGGTVETAAWTAGIDRRQLHRLFHRHLGVGPKELADLERLHASLRDVQTGRGEPTHGYSDQAHQIRSWRRRLGVTPGAYTGAARPLIANNFASDDMDQGLAYYL